MTRGPFIVLGILLLLVLGAGYSLLAGNDVADGQAAHGQEFQEIVGGLGFGPATDLSQDANNFDPRLSPRCTGDLGPLPAGGPFCPGHACSIFAYPPLSEETARPE
ncbi:MAG TPA: hypothetical protein VFA18_03745 [Gemmataceae bacterium]|nr:hypothetical protein [Gemmataceae bacterium]